MTETKDSCEVDWAEIGHKYSTEIAGIKEKCEQEELVLLFQ